MKLIKRRFLQSRSKLCCVVALSIIGTVSCGDAHASELSQRELAKMRADPRDYMDRIPTKYDSRKQQLSSVPRFTIELIESKEFIRLKDNARSRIVNDRATDLSDFAGIKLYEDDPRSLVDGGNVPDDLETIVTEGLQKSALSESPWSGDYWAIYKGNIASRYADPAFPSSTDWKENFDYAQQNPAMQIVSNGNPEAIDLLSPAEKYSLIVGDADGELSKRMWAEGKYYYESQGEVETWFGICHGWAPAAYMLKRPQKIIQVPAFNHEFDVTFYPTDIQALASLLWASSRAETRFIGGRCNDKNPKKDENGRVISQDCFDTNPGSWHQVVVGQIGRSKRSMVIDATFDYQVWNQPVLKYEYTYFDPKTLESADSLEAATQPLSALEVDRFAKYRDPRTKFVVGISMELTYMVETFAHRSALGTPEEDRMHTVVYLYDVELDSEKKIIGGEWYSNSHPDFIWTPAENAKARNFSEFNLRESWPENGRVPASWTRVARNSARSGQVLGLVIENLIKRAH